MTHSYVEENSIADRYLMGSLSRPEEASFEEHLVGCVECLNRLEIAERFQRGLRGATAEASERNRIVPWHGPPSGTAEHSRWRLLVLCAAAAFLVIGGAALTHFTEAQRVRRDLDAATKSYSVLEQDYQRERQTTDRLEQQLHQLQERGRPPNPVSSDVTNSRSETGPTLSGEQSLALFTLNMVRGADSGVSHPVNEIAVKRSTKRILLLLECEPILGAEFYEATIFDDEGTSVWKASRLKFNSNRTIELLMNSSLLRTGNYMVSLDSCTRVGECRSVTKYSFHAIFRK